MSSRVAQRHAAGSYDSCDSRVSASGRLITLVAALMIALATLFVGIAMPRQASAAEVVPEKLRTLDHGRPWSDDQFASTRLSSNRDMSR